MSDIFKLGTQHETPVGASFAPSGWYAPFRAATVYAVGWVTFDLEQLANDLGAGLATALGEKDGETGKRWIDLLTKDGGQFDWKQKSRSDKFKYYYSDRERADVLCALLNKEEPAYSGSRQFNRRPEQRWRIETAVADVVSLTDEAKAKFESDVLSWEIEQKGIVKNSKDWFKWHGLGLPMIVASYAALMKWDTPGFDIGELTKPSDDVIVTDKLQLDLVGNTDVGYEGSNLYTRRKALWASLGEDDVKVSNFNDTGSDKLRAALEVANCDWDGPVWCRVIQVPSPRVDDAFPGRDGQRIRARIPVVTAFYADRASAIAAYNAEMAERGSDDAPVATETKAATDGATPNVPEAWKEIPDDWLETVKTVKEQIGKKPKPVVIKMLSEMDLEGEYMATADEFFAAWDSVE